jgi:hypothetical protein
MKSKLCSMFLGRSEYKWAREDAEIDFVPLGDNG